MKARECTGFLQWALPQVGLRWPGFRKVRRLVCKRLAKRLRELGFRDLAHYRAMFERDAQERRVFDALCRIPISRFHRDRGVFGALANDILPALGEQAMARGEQVLRAWSAGCASGEEPYTLRIVWAIAVQARCPGIELHVVATDAGAAMLERARAGCYGSGSLRDLPRDWLPLAFEERNGLQCVRDRLREHVEFIEQDIRLAMPGGPFDLILCRNLAFTYFDHAVQEEVGAGMVGRLHPGGVLAIGIHEKLPAALDGLQPIAGARALFRKMDTAAA